ARGQAAWAVQLFLTNTAPTTDDQTEPAQRSALAGEKISTKHRPTGWGWSARLCGRQYAGSGLSAECWAGLLAIPSTHRAGQKLCRHSDSRPRRSAPLA